MKITVSFETATRMKAAGFPQPQPEFGQSWFVMWSVWQIGVVGFIANRAWQDGLIRVAIESEAEKIYGNKQFENFVYAPDVADILAEMPDTPFRYSKKYKAFVCGAYEHENPAEASALAWLNINEKK